MGYFIVFQNRSYDEEKNGGYLWAPRKDNLGREHFFWSNMTKINEGDIIFSVCKRNVVSINTAKGRSIEADRPTKVSDQALQQEDGWLVKVRYNVLGNPIDIDGNTNEILKLCPSNYSPFTKEGKGNQGYLYEIGNELGEYLLKLANA
ncbi:MAG: hypothetical protein E7211_16855 [Clostridium lundense]|nr:hypothetical protein [Clostridium lundense]